MRFAIKPTQLPAPRKPVRRAFTLLELLVVIGIIALLASILLPVLASVREQGRAVVCQSHERQLWQSIVAFGADHDERLVGNLLDTGRADHTERDFLYGSSGWTAAPQAGTLWPYTNHTAEMYLCPSREIFAGIGSANNNDLSSNGHFDYAIFLSFTGVKLSHLPLQTKVTHIDGTTEIIPTPYLCEEGPNHINGPNIEGGHSNIDLLGHDHFGGSYYAAPDGSCQFYNEPNGVVANSYTACGPSGQWQPIGHTGSPPTWGVWGCWDSK